MPTDTRSPLPEEGTAPDQAGSTIRRSPTVYRAVVPSAARSPHSLPSFRPRRFVRPHPAAIPPEEGTI